ncbi:MAG TPA: hypothetical protein DCZ94_03360 [Lentisphaeria bacterium]|nr:MAG: hypothetical protein A2X48_04025 [Lentisphaerae bacterium GWF2_49_21]HBC85972.1 hypothetical protein [Lentisphaeria bacterium]
MFLRALIFFLMLSIVGSSVLSAEIRIAILGDLEKNRAEIDSLTALLSKEPGINLVERSEIDKIIKEQSLSVLGIKTKDAIKAGSLLGAKGVIIIKFFEWEGKNVLSARLVGTESGAVLDAWIQGTPSEEANHFAKSVKFKFLPLFEKLSLNRKDIFALSLMGIRSPVDSPEGKELERKLTLLLSQRLILEKSFVVLERWRLGNIAWEKELNLDETPLWTSSSIVDGSVESLHDGKGTLKVSIRLRSPGGKSENFEINGSTLDLKLCVDSIAKDICERIGAGKTELSWDSSKEAEFYFNEAEWLFRSKAYARAREAVDASRALGRKGLEIDLLHIRACQEEIRGRIQEYASKKNKSEDNRYLTFETADLIAEALDLNVKFLEENQKFPPPPFFFGGFERDAIDPVCILSHIWIEGLYVKEPRWKAKVKLISSLARKAVALIMEKGDAFSDIYIFYSQYMQYIGFIFERPEDAIAEYRRLLAKELPSNPKLRIFLRERMADGIRINCWDMQKLNREGKNDYEASDKPGIAFVKALIKDLENSASEQDRIDAMILGWRDLPDAKLESFLWDERDSIMSDNDKTGHCAEVLLRQIRNKDILMKMLLYAFSKDYLLNAKLVRDILAINMKINDGKKTGVSKEEYDRLATAWWDYRNRVDSKLKSSPQLLKNYMGNIDLEISKCSNVRRLEGAASVMEISPDLVFDIGKGLSEKVGAPTNSVAEKIFLHAGQLQISGHCGTLGKPRDNPKISVDDINHYGIVSFLASIDPVTDVISFDFAPDDRKSISDRGPHTGYAGGWAGDMLGDGTVVYYAALDGKVYRKNNNSQWNLLAESGFTAPLPFICTKGNLFIAYSKSKSKPYSGIVKIGTNDGKVEILASSRRNPPLSPFDNCEALEAWSLDCSDNGVLVANFHDLKSTLATLDIAKGEWKTVISGASGRSSGSIHYWEYKTAYIFDGKEGALRKTDLSSMMKEKFLDIVNPEYRRCEGKIVGDSKQIVRLSQLDARLYEIRILDMDSGKARICKFHLKTDVPPDKGRFMKSLALAGDHVYLLAVGKYDQWGEDNSDACLFRIKLSAFPYQ